MDEPGPAMTKKFVFVMEQGLGHVVHTLNLEHVLSRETDIDATILRIRPEETARSRCMPLANNWSVQMSSKTRQILNETLPQRRPDAVFIHTQVAALFATKIMHQVPTVVSLDATPVQFDTMSGAYRHRRQSALLEQAKLWINRRALTSAAAVVTWSRWAAESVIHDYGLAADRVHPIYPGVEIGKFSPTSKKDHTGPLRVLFVGGDFVRKGGNDLVEAVARLGGCVELDIVSSANDIQIPSHVPIRIHRTITPNSGELLELMASAEVFALPTHGDTLALAITEAMASGLPVVATAVGAIPEMVVNGVSGILVPPGNVAEIARALEALASDGSLRQRMGNAGRALAESQHDTMSNWRRIFALMTDAANCSEGVNLEAVVTPGAG
jgi:glycosyltransferase involved in cell wall biosynthesis